MRTMLKQLAFLCGVCVLLAALLCLSGCVTPSNSAGPYQPEWMTECHASCASGYAIRWEQLLEAPKGEGLARELEEQCIIDLSRNGCTWPICKCKVEEKK